MRIRRQNVTVIRGEGLRATVNLTLNSAGDQSLMYFTVRKKMAAVHFTTIPCEPNKAICTHKKPYFGEIYPCTNKIVYGKV